MIRMIWDWKLLTVIAKQISPIKTFRAKLTHIFKCYSAYSLSWQLYDYESGYREKRVADCPCGRPATAYNLTTWKDFPVFRCGWHRDAKLVAPKLTLEELNGDHRTDG